jgi:hypothetical protein
MVSDDVLQANSSELQDQAVVQVLVFSAESLDQAVPQSLVYLAVFLGLVERIVE